MKALLLHRDRDFDLQQPLPWNAAILTQDLALETLIEAMANGDKFLPDVCRAVLFSGFSNQTDTVLYRQEILDDCFANAEIVRTLYSVTLEATDRSRRSWWDLSSHYPDSLLSGATSLLTSLLETLRKVRRLADEATGKFHSEGFTALFAMLHRELNDEYLHTLQQYLADLAFRDGTLLSAELRDNNEGGKYTLIRPPTKEAGWFQRLLAKPVSGYTFRIDPRDETGARIVSEIRHTGISRVAVTVAHSAEHVLSFFTMLRTEVAFYIGCLNLHEALSTKGVPVCFPIPEPQKERRHCFAGLYDVCLALHLQGKVVGNDADMGDKSLAIITGANQGGKSSFLRSIGLAQMMMQCGMFVGADSFHAELCPGLFTHYKREEDADMTSGKLDEELARMSEIANHLTPHSILLLNESFAATNEREGSEIATQIIRAMQEKQIKVFFVTHQYEFAHGWLETHPRSALFLRAERLADGTRTFRLLPKEPIETSYGEDLYKEIFAGS